MKIYKVGGSVRDKILGELAQDNDYVVVGATVEEMLEQGYKQVGKDFPVFLHPETNEDVLADFGPYGPYVKCGKINASMKSDESPLTITLENALKLIKDRKLKFEPKVLGEHPKTKNEISIKRGRFGPYVTDGKKNVSLKGYVVDEVTLDQAVKLIDEKS